jgi:Flp pilus assembly protein TadB
MTIVTIGALLIACAYLFKRTYDARAENASLRVQVASLKRQLARMRG